MVAAAGGVDVLGRAGEPSFPTTWEVVRRLEPELVVLAPCGFDVARTAAEAFTGAVARSRLSRRRRRRQRLPLAAGAAHRRRRQAASAPAPSRAPPRPRPARPRAGRVDLRPPRRRRGGGRDERQWCPTPTPAGARWPPIATTGRAQAAGARSAQPEAREPARSQRRGSRAPTQRRSGCRARTSGRPGSGR
jgi:hypothetical protein